MLYQYIDFLVATKKNTIHSLKAGRCNISPYRAIHVCCSRAWTFLDERGDEEEEEGVKGNNSRTMILAGYVSLIPAPPLAASPSTMRGGARWTDSPHLAIVYHTTLGQ